MKKILTSNFAKSSKDPNAIAICQGVPHWYKGKRYLPIAPTWEMIKLAKAGDMAFYNIRYAEILGNLDPQKVYDELCDMVEGDPIILCWEKDPNDCHRKTVGEWLNKHMGVETAEVLTLVQQRALETSKTDLFGI